MFLRPLKDLCTIYLYQHFVGYFYRKTIRHSGFFLNFAFNFDDVTVQKSKSTKSFWNGTLPETTWQYYQKEELIGFYQLFSPDEIEFIYKMNLRE